MERRRTEYETGYREVHGCPLMLRTNLRSIGTKLHSLKACMQLLFVRSGMKVYLPSPISPALSALHKLTSHDH